MRERFKDIKVPPAPSPLSENRVIESDLSKVAKSATTC
jgi:hypothetical protein